MLFVVLTIPIILLLVLAFIAAFATGANDSTMGSLVGAKVLSSRNAVILGGILMIIGAVALGQGVSTTIGTGMVTQPLSVDLVFVISLAIIVWMLFSAYLGYPISATHSIVGGIIGIGLLGELGLGTPLVRWDTISIIVFGWVVSPILSLAIAYCLQWVVRNSVLVKSRGLAEVERKERIFGVLLLVMVIVICLSRGGNDVAKAIGLLTIFFTGPLDFSLLLFLGGLGMAIGLVILGRRVVRTVGIELTELRPSASFSSATASAIVLLVGTIMGIPLAATHILITSIIGATLVHRISSNKRVLRKLILTSLLTVPVSAILAICFWGIYQITLYYVLIAL
ncbi:MAG: inorganic phosphate transporter [Promethearchaeota archaeon]